MPPRAFKHIGLYVYRRDTLLTLARLAPTPLEDAEMLEQLDRELNADGVHLAFVEMRSRLQRLVQRYGLFATIDRDHFYPTIGVAIDEISRG